MSPPDRSTNTEGMNEQKGGRRALCPALRVCVLYGTKKIHESEVASYDFACQTTWLRQQQLHDKEVPIKEAVTTHQDSHPDAEEAEG